MVFLAHVSFKNVAEFRLPPQSDEPDHLALQGAAHLKIFLGSAERRSRHLRRTLTAGLNETLCLKARERRPRKRTAHAELFADGIFRQPCTRRQRLLNDGSTQGPVGTVGAGWRRGHCIVAAHLARARSRREKWHTSNGPTSIRVEERLCILLPRYIESSPCFRLAVGPRGLQN